MQLSFFWPHVGWYSLDRLEAGLLETQRRTCAGKEPAVEVREQDAQGRVHRVVGSGPGLTEASREAQAQTARRQQLMKASSQVRKIPPPIFAWRCLRAVENNTKTSCSKASAYFD